MNLEQRGALFRETYGRPAKNEAELRGGELHTGFMMNRDDRERAARVRAFAESVGGDTLAYAKVRWGYYWGPTELVSPLDAATTVGISEDRETQIVVAVMQAAKGGGSHPEAAAC